MNIACLIIMGAMFLNGGVTGQRYVDVTANNVETTTESTTTTSSTTTSSAAVASAEDIPTEVVEEVEDTATTETVELEAYDIKIACEDYIENMASAYDGIVVFADQVEYNSDGRITSELVFNYSKDVGRDILGDVQSGNINMAVVPASTMAEKVPEFNLFGTPFMFSTIEQAEKVYGSTTISNYLKQVSRQSGFEYLTTWGGDFQNITLNTEISSITSLPGLKIRVESDVILMNILTSLGVTPTQMNAGEVYLALQQGVIDGQASTFGTTLNNNWNEVQSFAVETKHTYDTYVVVMNYDWYNALPTEDKEFIQGIISDINSYQYDLAEDYEAITTTEIESYMPMLKISDTERMIASEMMKSMGVRNSIIESCGNTEFSDMFYAEVSAATK